MSAITLLCMLIFNNSPVWWLSLRLGIMVSKLLNSTYLIISEFLMSALAHLAPLLDSQCWTLYSLHMFFLWHSFSHLNLSFPPLSPFSHSISHSSFSFPSPTPVSVSSSTLPLLPSLIPFSSFRHYIPSLIPASHTFSYPYLSFPSLTPVFHFLLFPIFPLQNLQPIHRLVLLQSVPVPSFATLFPDPLSCPLLPFATSLLTPWTLPCTEVCISF